MIRIAINGILGRMGQELVHAILQDEDLILIGGIDTLETFYGDDIVVTTNPNEIISDVDVMLDFSSAPGTAAIAEACIANKLPFITGTTGLSEQQQAQIVLLAETVPVVQSCNFSLGMNLLVNILKKTVTILKNHFDAEIVEIHHRKKKASPSDTAVMLAKTIAQVMELPDPTVIRFGRGENQAAHENEITIHSLRGGSVVGNHQVHLFCENENIIMTHEALSPKAFVTGVLRAVEWIPLQPPGLYSMQDVLDLI